MFHYKTREVKVKEFDTAMGNPVNVPMNTKYIELKMRLIHEELKELEKEIQINLIEAERGKLPDLQYTLKEAADLQYVLSGLLCALGIDKVFDEAFNRVHESNLSKLGSDGKPRFRDDGKVLKGENYKPACMKGLVPHG